MGGPLDYHGFADSWTIRISHPDEMKAGSQQKDLTAKMASFVKIKLKDNSKGKKARTPEPESTHSLDFEDSVSSLFLFVF